MDLPRSGGGSLCVLLLGRGSPGPQRCRGLVGRCSPPPQTLCRSVLGRGNGQLVILSSQPPPFLFFLRHPHWQLIGIF